MNMIAALMRMIVPSKMTKAKVTHLLAFSQGSGGNGTLGGIGVA